MVEAPVVEQHKQRDGYPVLVWRFPSPVRTLATTEPRYDPMSYHNGSVWPHDNALVAIGFARYGFQREAARIFAGLFSASTHIDLRRLPELFCGFPRQRSHGPTFYPVR